MAHMVGRANTGACGGLACLLPRELYWLRRLFDHLTYKISLLGFFINKPLVCNECNPAIKYVREHKETTYKILWTAL